MNAIYAWFQLNQSEAESDNTCVYASISTVVGNTYTLTSNDAGYYVAALMGIEGYTSDDSQATDYTVSASGLVN